MPSQTGRLVWVVVAAIATVLIGIYYLFLYITTAYVPQRLRAPRRWPAASLTVRADGRRPCAVRSPETSADRTAGS